MNRASAATLATLLSSGVAATVLAEVVDPSALDFLPQSPGVAGGAVGGFVNPAAWATGTGELAFLWDDRSLKPDALDDWGFSWAAPLGFAARRATFLDASGNVDASWDYRLGFAGGDRRSFGGVAWRWTRGAAPGTVGDEGPVFGSLFRPDRHVSFGTATFLSTESSYRESSVDLGIRPFGTSRLSLFGDASWDRDRRWDDPAWSAGLEVRPVRGFHLGGRVRDAAGGGQEYLLSAGITLDRLGAHVLSARNEDGDRGTTTYLVRMDPPYAGLPLPARGARHPTRIRTFDLHDKSVGYRKDIWFDDDRIAWLDLVQELRAARDDPATAGVALKLDGVRLRPSIAWELRREIDGLTDAGKRVFVHADRLRMSTYYAAAGAERLSLDPYGDLELPGIALQRTYLQGLLEKAGIGFEEHRLFRYKSAMETYSRHDMSEADREQLGRLAEALYAALRDGIATGRGLDPAQVDSLVDGEGIFLPERAVEAGLADAAERWDDLKTWAEGEGLSFAPDRAVRALPEERWGPPPVVALVYADGICDLQEGIRGRATSEHLQRLARRHDVAGVILRADSPGGDPLASDLVAGGLAALRDQGTPVVVSQGDVAASGGYWISLDADRVFTTPLTITGSIGVISGWAWDEGFSGKTGLTADGVQRGRHADLFGGLRIPLTGLRLPTRNLDADERKVVDRTITSLYDRFVAKVSEMRELPEETVRDVAQGRVWSGGDAVDRGLCDDLGGLADALDEVRTRAGLAPGDEIRIEEFPARRLLRVPGLGAALPSLGLRTVVAAAMPTAADEDYDLQYLRALTRQPGAPQLLLPPDALPREWREP